MNKKESNNIYNNANEGPKGDKSKSITGKNQKINEL